jgi:hypothetical protein
MRADPPSKSNGFKRVYPVFGISLLVVNGFEQTQDTSFIHTSAEIYQASRKLEF